jgi:hypothetical protein
MISSAHATGKSPRSATISVLPLHHQAVITGLEFCQNLRGVIARSIVNHYNQIDILSQRMGQTVSEALCTVMGHNHTSKPVSSGVVSRNREHYTLKQMAKL